MKNQTSRATDYIPKRSVMLNATVAVVRNHGDAKLFLNINYLHIALLNTLKATKN